MLWWWVVSKCIHTVRPHHFFAARSGLSASLGTVHQHGPPMPAHQHWPMHKGALALTDVRSYVRAPIRRRAQLSLDKPKLPAPTTWPTQTTATHRASMCAPERMPHEHIALCFPIWPCRREHHCSYTHGSMCAVCIWTCNTKAHVFAGQRRRRRRRRGPSTSSD